MDFLFGDLYRMNKRQVGCVNSVLVAVMKHLFSGVLSSPELWDDSVFSIDDMEGSDGGNWQ